MQGNQITVEALVYIDGSNTLAENVVSKHVNFQNVNYLLRPKTFELTTYISGNNGPTQFLQMWNPFTLTPNKWYHVAGTYDGVSVKYYVDGCLVIEQPFSGNLFQNNFSTAIGNQSDCQCEQFLGKIDEVRIWNVCRTQEEIQTNMINLPNPISQQGLIAYYKFDNTLLNLQGNSALDGVFMGNVQYATDQVTIQPFRILNIQINSETCDKAIDGEIIISSNRSNSEYSLDNINYQSLNIFSNLQAGIYHIFIKSPEGCIIDSIVSVNNEHFYFQINDSASICRGQTYNGFSDTGIYVDTMKSDTGCDSIYTLSLTVWDNPPFLETISICEGETYEGYSVNGIYSDTFMAHNGCDSTRILHLLVNPSFDIRDTAIICEGDSYNFNGEVLTQEGIYTHAMQTLSGCDSTITLFLKTYKNYFLGDNLVVCGEQEYLLESPFENTQWFDNTISKTKLINETGTYWATILDVNGCKIIDSISISFNTKIYVPSAFSPNNDGINDCFRPIFSEPNVSGYKLWILNRWGNLIYKTTDINDCWNGYHKTEICPPGVYTYHIEVEIEGCKKHKKGGTITLIQ